MTGRIVDFVLQAAAGRPGALSAVTRCCLAGLSYVYRAGLATYLLPYRLGIRRRYRLGRPVICIGSLAAGGTGKTPLTALVCRVLQQNGFKVCILSRGYRGENEYGCACVSDGSKLFMDARSAGDEAFMLAEQLPGAAVYVGKDRRQTGEAALASARPDVFVLDDGMQYWQLHKDLTIAALDANQPLGSGWTLPRGLLRVPPGHLLLASAVVLTGAGKLAEEVIECSQALIASIAPGLPVFISQTDISGVSSLATGHPLEADWLRGRHVYSLCGIANPSRFEETLISTGATIVRSVHLEDHAAVSREVLEALAIDARTAGADAIVITSKDAVKLGRHPLAVPIVILETEARVKESSEFNRLILSAVQGCRAACGQQAAECL